VILDAIGADQIRSGIATAADTTAGHATDVAVFGGILAEAGDRYEQLGMTTSTISHLRAAAASTTAAAAHLGTAGEQLQAALCDFDARDGHVAAAVADAGNLMQAEGYTQTFTLPGAAAAGPTADPDRTGQDGKQEQEPQLSPADWADSYRMSPKPVSSGWTMGDEEFRQLLTGGLPERHALQARTDGAWAEVAIRGDAADCTATWSQREHLRVVESPPPYQAPQKEDGDEFYAFDGDLRDGKPPYWTRREGRTVVSQSLGGQVTRTEHPDLDTARAAFAEDSCDPDGAGAPRSHDLIEVHWGQHEGQQLRVSAVTAGPGRGDYVVEAQPAVGGPAVAVDLNFGQYRIMRRRPAPRRS
jgi:hypothetical protein